VHAAERFLHAKVEALPVVEDGRFLGMLSIGTLCAATVAWLEER
jgi:CBS domain-containing protein